LQHKLQSLKRGYIVISDENGKPRLFGIGKMTKRIIVHIITSPEKFCFTRNTISHTALKEQQKKNSCSGIKYLLIILKGLEG